MKRKRRGLLLQADDLDVGRWVAIHHWRHQPDCNQGLGHALIIKAINLPFVVVQPHGEPQYEPAILDVREAAFMFVTQDFVNAQHGPFPGEQ